ncbi:hypothetical protein, partial [Klebsiella aerogenes]|uniref:hypothetical protein n=1 Tax=Klebsiella aerogenes TaxID=548 RepID=UPI001CC500E0
CNGTEPSSPWSTSVSSDASGSDGSGSVDSDTKTSDTSFNSYSSKEEGSVFSCDPQSSFNPEKSQKEDSR